MAAVTRDSLLGETYKNQSINKLCWFVSSDGFIFTNNLIRRQYKLDSVLAKKDLIKR